MKKTDNSCLNLWSLLIKIPNNPCINSPSLITWRMVSACITALHLINMRLWIKMPLTWTSELQWFTSLETSSKVSTYFIIIHCLGVGVVIASIIIYFKPEWHIADPICTFIFTFLVLFTTIPIFKDCVVVLMEATPKSIDVSQCFEDLIQVSLIFDANLIYSWILLTRSMTSMCGPCQ